MSSAPSTTVAQSRVLEYAGRSPCVAAAKGGEISAAHADKVDPKQYFAALGTRSSGVSMTVLNLASESEMPSLITSVTTHIRASFGILHANSPPNTLQQAERILRNATIVIHEQIPAKRFVSCRSIKCRLCGFLR